MREMRNKRNMKRVNIEAKLYNGSLRESLDKGESDMSLFLEIRRAIRDRALRRVSRIRIRDIAEDLDLDEREVKGFESLYNEAMEEMLRSIDSNIFTQRIYMGRHIPGHDLKREYGRRLFRNPRKDNWIVNMEGFAGEERIEALASLVALVLGGKSYYKEVHDFLMKKKDMQNPKKD